MSRLYVWVENDKGQQKTLGSDYTIDVTVNYGSKEKSIRAVKVFVTFPSGTDKPVIEVRVPENLKEQASLSFYT